MARLRLGFQRRGAGRFDPIGHGHSEREMGRTGGSRPT